MSWWGKLDKFTFLFLICKGWLLRTECRNQKSIAFYVNCQNVHTVLYLSPFKVMVMSIVNWMSKWVFSIDFFNTITSYIVNKINRVWLTKDELFFYLTTSILVPLSPSMTFCNFLFVILIITTSPVIPYDFFPRFFQSHRSLLRLYMCLYFYRYVSLLET